MRKTMYLAMRSLALFIASNKDEMSFEDLFEKWMSQYKPLEEQVSELQAMGKRLYDMDAEEIKKVPEERYRKAVKYTLTPEIQKGSPSPRLKAGACKEERKLLLAGKHF